MTQPRQPLTDELVQQCIQELVSSLHREGLHLHLQSIGGTWRWASLKRDGTFLCHTRRCFHLKLKGLKPNVR